MQGYSLAYQHSWIFQQHHSVLAVSSRNNIHYEDIVLQCKQWMKGRHTKKHHVCSPVPLSNLLSEHELLGTAEWVEGHATPQSQYSRWGVASDSICCSLTSLYTPAVDPEVLYLEPNSSACQGCIQTCGSFNVPHEPIRDAEVSAF